jgi:hypothetical protein
MWVFQPLADPAPAFVRAPMAFTPSGQLLVLSSEGAFNMTSPRDGRMRIGANQQVLPTLPLQPSFTSAAQTAALVTAPHGSSKAVFVTMPSADAENSLQALAGNASKSVSANGTRVSSATLSDDGALLVTLSVEHETLVCLDAKTHSVLSVAKLASFPLSENSTVTFGSNRLVFVVGKDKLVAFEVAADGSHIKPAKAFPAYDRSYAPPRHARPIPFSSTGGARAIIFAGGSDDISAFAVPADPSITKSVTTPKWTFFVEPKKDYVMNPAGGVADAFAAKASSPAIAVAISRKPGRRCVVALCASCKDTAKLWKEIEELDNAELCNSTFAEARSVSMAPVVSAGRIFVAVNGGGLAMFDVKTAQYLGFIATSQPVVSLAALPEASAEPLSSGNSQHYSVFYATLDTLRGRIATAVSTTSSPSPPPASPTTAAPTRAPTTAAPADSPPAEDTPTSAPTTRAPTTRAPTTPAPPVDEDTPAPPTTAAPTTTTTGAAPPTTTRAVRKTPAPTPKPTPEPTEAPEPTPKRVTPPPARKTTRKPTPNPEPARRTPAPTTVAPTTTAVPPTTAATATPPSDNSDGGGQGTPFIFTAIPWLLLVLLVVLAYQFRAQLPGLAAQAWEKIKQSLDDASNSSNTGEVAPAAVTSGGDHGPSPPGATGGTSFVDDEDEMNQIHGGARDEDERDTAPLVLTPPPTSSSAATSSGAASPNPVPVAAPKSKPAGKGFHRRKDSNEGRENLSSTGGGGVSSTSMTSSTPGDGASAAPPASRGPSTRGGFRAGGGGAQVAGAARRPGFGGAGVAPSTVLDADAGDELFGKTAPKTTSVNPQPAPAPAVVPTPPPPQPAPKPAAPAAPSKAGWDDFGDDW